MVEFDSNAIMFATIGGIILGLSTSINYIIRGKVTGMSGIAYGIISLNKSNLYILLLLRLITLKIIYCWWHVFYFIHILFNF